MPTWCMCPDRTLQQQHHVPQKNELNNSERHRACFLGVMSFAIKSARVDAPDVGWLKTAFAF